MLPDLAQKAIEEALKGNWTEAVNLNKELLSQNPKDAEALNRLARAYLELGRAADSRTIYKRVLRFSPYNPIAQKALERLTNVKRIKKQKDGQLPKPTTGDSFIEEPGKTKTITLIHLGDKTVLTSLDSGDPVILRPHRHRVSVETQDHHYVGRIPDDLSRRLIKLTRGGNEYVNIVRSSTPDCVRIFVRETKKAEILKDTTSFPIEKNNYSSFTPPESVHSDKPEIQNQDYEEEII